MSTTPTLVGPTATQQINTSLYVGEGYLLTMQNAVDFAVINGGYHRIVIPTGYPGTDTIASLVRGASAAYIADERFSNTQYYVWDGTKYAGPTIQLDGLLINDCAIDLNGHSLVFGTGPEATEIDPSGNLSAPTLQLSGDATIGGDISADNLQLAGDATIVGDVSANDVLAAGSPVRTFANTPDAPAAPTYPPAGIGISTGTAWENVSIDPDTVPLLDSEGVLNLPNSVQIGDPNSQLADSTVLVPRIAMAVAGTEGTKYPGQFTFNTSNPTTASPLQTLSLTHYAPDLGNTPVIFTISRESVSMQTATSSSITNPASGLSIGWNLKTGDGETDFFNASGGGGGGFSWYNGGPEAVFTPASTPVMMLNNAANLTVQGNLQSSSGNLILNPAGGGAGATVLAGSDGNMHINPGGAAILQCWDSGTGTIFGNGHAGGVASIDAAGNFTANGTIHCGDIFSSGGIDVTGTGVTANIYELPSSGNLAGGGNNILLNAGPSTTGQVLLNWNSGATGGTTFGNGGSVPVGHVDGGGNAQFSGRLDVANLTILPRSGEAGFNTPNINSDGTSLIFNASGIYLGWDIQGTTYFGNGSGASVASIDQHGVITGTAKNFKIPHPLDDTKDLVHSCVEGPELAVFYRGEGRTQNGFTIITLPDYFEALTRPEKRTVQITALFEDDDESFGMVAAGRVADGMFRVRSDNPSQRFYWEVKAVRADKDELEVETERIAPLTPEALTVNSTAKKGVK
jgi:cytoskeletal protein CcmA (bactofilin family)